MIEKHKQSIEAIMGSNKDFKKKKRNSVLYDKMW